MKAQTLYQYILTVYSECEDLHIENPYDDVTTIRFGVMQTIVDNMEAYGSDEIYSEDILKIIYDEYIKYWIKNNVKDSIKPDVNEQCYFFLRELLNLVHNILTNHNRLWYNTYGYICIHN